jgi:O-antigen/teichoic acid export membrane protein
MGNFMSKLLKNTGFLFIAKGISAVLILIYTVSLARYLGPSDYGIIAYALAFMGLITSITDLGLYPLVTREVAKNRDDAKNFFGNILGIKLLLTTATVIIMLAYLFWGVAYLNDRFSFKFVVAVVSITIYYILRSYSDLFYAVYLAFERTSYVGLGYILINSIICFWTFIMILFNKNIIVLTIGFAIAGLISLFYNMYIISKKFFTLKVHFNISMWKDIIYDAIYFGFLIILVSINYRTDSIMIGIMSGDYMVGLYGAPYKVIEGLNYLIPTVLFAIVYPKMSKYFKNTKMLKNIYAKTIKLSLYTTLILSIIVSIFSKNIIMALYGQEYAESVFVLQILIWSFFITCLNYPTQGLLNSIGNQKYVAKISFMGTIVNIILNFILIPKYGIYGASMTTVITGIIIFLLGYFQVTRILEFEKTEIIKMIVISKEDLNILKNKNILELIKSRIK